VNDQDTSRPQLDSADHAERKKRRREAKLRKRIFEAHRRNVQRFGKRPDKESVVKQNVRRRDGYRCRDCGMTHDEHVERYGKTLEVHRVHPGSTYSEDRCVTLCRRCHAKKKGKADLERIDIFFSLYFDDGDVRRLLKIANAERVTLTTILDRALADFIRRHGTTEAKPDLSRQGDCRP
jgi:5-methylcytosine-specific restriction endonuclease McrA